jgi:hypothetical protein
LREEKDLDLKAETTKVDLEKINAFVSRTALSWGSTAQGKKGNLTNPFCSMLQQACTPLQVPNTAPKVQSNANKEFLLQQAGCWLPEHWPPVLGAGEVLGGLP